MVIATTAVDDNGRGIFKPFLEHQFAMTMAKGDVLGCSGGQEHRALSSPAPLRIETYPEY
jgi:hypothetical protein